jgi:hypothetical protein
MPLRSVRVWLGTCGVAACCGHALAQAPPGLSPTDVKAEEKAVIEKPAEKRPVTFSIAARTAFDFDTNLSGSPGDVAVTRAGVTLGVGIPADENGQVRLSLRGEADGYSFHDATGVIPGTTTPWETVLGARLGAVYFHRQSLQTAWLIGGDIESRGEEGASFEKTLAYDGIVGFRFFASEQLTLGFTLGIRTRLEDNPQFIPVPVVDWDIAPEWHLETDNDWDRLGGLLSYSPKDSRWVFALRGGYEFRDFRLDRDGPLPNGVVRDNEAYASLAATFKPTKRIELIAEGGVNFGGEFKIFDSGGNEQRTINVDAGPFVALQARFTF